jgi:hypothetical protein
MSNAIERYKFEYYLENAIEAVLGSDGIVPIYITSGTDDDIDDLSVSVVASLGSPRQGHEYVTLRESGNAYTEFTHYDGVVVVRLVIDKTDVNGDALDWAEQMALVRRALNDTSIDDINALMSYHHLDYLMPVGTERTTDAQNRMVVSFTFSFLMRILDSAFLPDPEPDPEDPEEPEEPEDPEPEPE